MGSIEVSKGDIPVLSAAGQCLSEAWEKAVLAVWESGLEIKTEYDKAGDPPSKDATVMITVVDPFSEPRIHRNIPGGPEELEAYRQEVCLGIHDHWIDPAAGKWTYTYHERLFSYSPVVDLRNPHSEKPFESVNQIDYVVRKCSESFYTRRAQAITWMPTADPETDDPPCLQRLWFRIVLDAEGNPVLNMNSHWRSRDLYKAWFMNAYALTHLQKIVADRISGIIEKPVRVGRYVDITDSLHIYGSYCNEELTAEMKKMKSSPYTERAWNTAALEPIFEEVRENLRRDPDYYAHGGP